MPRLYFPADRIQGAVGTCKTLAGRALDGTLQAALMDFAPALGQIGKKRRSGNPRPPPGYRDDNPERNRRLAAM